MSPCPMAAALLAIPLTVWPAPFIGHAASRPAATLASQSAVSAPTGVVRTIEFVGLRRVSPATLRAQIASRVGQPVDPGRIENDVRALGRLGWFDSIRVEVDPDPGDRLEGPGVRLVFLLEERPFLARLEFRGSRRLSRERIEAILAEKRISLKVAEPVNRFELWRAARAIEGALADVGHPEADVRVRLERVSEATVRATFEIGDGPQIRAGRVGFVGNRAFSGAVLRHQMKRVAPQARLASLRSKDIYTRERLAGDLQRVADYYRNHGFAEARLGFPKVELEQDRVAHWFPWPRQRAVPSLHISIPVEEGTFYRLAAVEVQNELAAAAPGQQFDALPAIRSLRPGEPYSQQKLERARQALARLRVPAAVSRSPAFPQVDAIPRFDRRAGKVSVTYRVREANPYIVRRIEFLGQKKFRDRFYRRRVLLKEGEPFDPAKLESGLTQLARTGFIRPVKSQDIRAKFDEARHTVDLAIRVEEIGQQKISLVGGRSELGNSLGIVYNVFDLFGGEELITAHFEGGPESLHLLLGIAKEGLFGTRASFGLSLYQDVIRPNLAVTSNRQHLFTSHTSGLALGSTYPVTPRDALEASYGLSRTSTQYDVPLPVGISGVAGNSLHSDTSNRSIGLNWLHDAGRERWAATGSVSGGWLGGDENFARSSLEYVRVAPDPLTGGRNAWAFRGYAAGVSSFRGDLPLHARYFTGEQLVRGFRTGELGPYAVVGTFDTNGTESFRAQPPGADLLGAANSEYRVPLAPRTEAAGFFDIGSGWLLPHWVGPDRPLLLRGTEGVLRASTGIEMRWTPPVVDQTIRVHFAINPLRLSRSILLPDGSRFQPPDRRTAWGWAFGSLF